MKHNTPKLDFRNDPGLSLFPDIPGRTFVIRRNQPPYAEGQPYDIFVVGDIGGVEHTLYLLSAMTWSTACAIVERNKTSDKPQP